MVRTTAALLALAATVPLTAAFPGVASTISDGQVQVSTSTANAVSTIADGQPQASKATSTAKAVSTISDGQPQAPAASAPAKKYKYVFQVSVDGMHSSDVEKYLAIRPKSTMATLLATGFEYTNAYTTGVSDTFPFRPMERVNTDCKQPSDSFPGTLTQFTGAGPATTGVWYDNTWDRSWWAPGSNCTGPPGANSMLIHLKSPKLNLSRASLIGR
jgi:hypothetical protein